MISLVRDCPKCGYDNCQVEAGDLDGNYYYCDNCDYEWFETFFDDDDDDFDDNDPKNDDLIGSLAITNLLMNDPE